MGRTGGGRDARSTNRKSAAGKTPGGRRPGGGPEDFLTPGMLRQITTPILRDTTGIAGVDPTALEVFASGIVSLWRQRHLPSDELGPVMAGAIVDALDRKGTADTLATLLGIAAIADEDVATRATAAAERLRASGVPEPISARAIGRPPLVDAWVSSDEFGDQSMVCASFAYDRWPIHALAMLFDHNLRGLVVGAWVTDDPAAIRDGWTVRTGLPIRALDEQRLADLLGTGIQWYDIYFDPPVSDDLHEIVPLLRGRLRALPPARIFEPPMVTDAARTALLDSFAASPEAAGLVEGAAADPADPAEVASWFVDFAVGYGAGDPERWSPPSVATLLTDWLPAKATMGSDTVAGLPEVLRAFVRFCARRRGLSATGLAETLSAIDDCEADFRTAMADPKAAGPAKQIATQMLADGVDFADEAAVGRWIEGYNAGLPGGKPR